MGKASDAGSSHPASANPQLNALAVARDRDGPVVRASAIVAGADSSAVGSPGAIKIRRLVADQRYFGLEAQAFHDGAERMLARVAGLAPERKRIDVRSLGEDFRLDAAASWALLRAMLTDGLLRPDGPANYRPARRFREYALAAVVAPLSRARARQLIEGACRLAERINTHWTRNPFRIKTIAVSGSYMSRRNRLPELALWLVLRRRPEAKMRRWGSPLGKSEALRQIVTSARALSSFVVIRVVADKEKVQRPFSVVFQSDEDDFDSSVPAWHRFREWGASISRRLASR